MRALRQLTSTRALTPENRPEVDGGRGVGGVGGDVGAEENGDDVVGGPPKGEKKGCAGLNFASFRGKAKGNLQEKKWHFILLASSLKCALVSVFPCCFAHPPNSTQGLSLFNYCREGRRGWYIFLHLTTLSLSSSFAFATSVQSTADQDGGDVVRGRGGGAKTSGPSLFMPSVEGTRRRGKKISSSREGLITMEGKATFERKMTFCKRMFYLARVLIKPRRPG